ncbi:ArgH [Actinidia rufa]|uniref:ArgH n=1 Tax=Actinidia rufa TaxID=165716 RepID=A0A7J0FH51_9ERIC|nr:ArgH [Actinidia rufa]
MSLGLANRGRVEGEEDFHIWRICTLGTRKLDTSVDAMVEEFEELWKPGMGEYSRKLVEFCCLKALISMCCNIEELINNGSFSRFTFDMMRAWERPSYEDEESYTESMAKEKEEKRAPVEVDDEPGVGEDAFVWLGTQVPLVCDVVNGRFTFETPTASTGNRLYFPAYDKYLKEIDKCMKNLQKQAKPKGVELADDEFILHVEGTASTQRVIRHIRGTSWPGRLTLTNYALYFEAAGVLSYEDAIKLDLSKNIEQSVKPAATGPWGAPLFDKAIVYESAELQEPVVLEFPDVASSMRRDHWLALIKEVMLLHQFLLKCNVKAPTQAWEMHARTIFGIIRLHAAREMMRICPPDPKNFLIFALYNELPKGDYVLVEFSESLKKADSGQPCSASSILRCMNVSQPIVLKTEVEGGIEEGISVSGQVENLSSLESAIEQVREEAKETEVAKATVEGLKEEGISDSILVLMELLKPLKTVVPWFQEILTWQRPATTVVVIAMSVVVIYKEWVGKALAVFLLWAVAKMIWARKEGIGNKRNKVVVCTASDQSAMETIISAQHGLKTARDMVQLANISILKIWSILLGKSPKHTTTVILALTGLAIVLAVVPIKYVLMAIVLCCFTMNSKLGRHMPNDKGNRRLKEWWDSIPVIPVEVVDKVPKTERHT